MRQYTQLKFYSLKHEAKQGNHDLWGFMSLVQQDFVQQHVYLYMQNESKIQSLSFHQKFWVLATNQETSQRKCVMNQGYLKKT